MGEENSKVASSARLEWVDVSRGIGMVLVVLGHVIAGLSGAGLKSEYSRAMQAVSDFIYSFHMAVFFLLAGMFAPRGLAKSAKVFWADKFATLVYPYLVWSVLQLSVQIAAAGYTNLTFTPRDLLRIFYNPPMQFWFIYCLFLCHAAYWFVARLGGNGWVFLVVSLLAAVAFEGLPGTTIPGRVRENMPTFALGVIFSARLQRAGSAPSWALAALVPVGSWLTWWAAWALRPMLFADVFVPLPATAALIALSILAARCYATFGMTTIGRFSLEIYLAHVLAYVGTRLVLIRVFGITSVPVNLVAGTVVGICGPLLLVRVARAFRVPYLFRWPAPRSR